MGTVHRSVCPSRSAIAVASWQRVSICTPSDSNSAARAASSCCSSISETFSASETYIWEASTANRIGFSERRHRHMARSWRPSRIAQRRSSMSPRGWRWEKPVSSVMRDDHARRLRGAATLAVQRCGSW